MIVEPFSTWKKSDITKTDPDDMTDRDVERFNRIHNTTKETADTPVPTQPDAVDFVSGSVGVMGEPVQPEQRAASIERAASPQIETAEAAQAEADSAQGFADWALADAGSLGADAPTIQKVEEEVNTVRREELPALVENADNKTKEANRALAIETFKALGVDPTEANIAGFVGVLGEATSDEERQQILAQTVDAHEKRQIFNEVRPQIDAWVTDMLGDQGVLVNREDLLVDVESMVIDGMSPAEIEVAMRARLENIRTRGLDSVSNGTVVDVFDAGHVVNVGLRIDQNDRAETRRQVLDTLQVTLGVASDEAVAEQLGVPVEQLGNTMLVRNAQNAAKPDDAIAQLQAHPQYQANAERRRLAEIATYAIADGAGYGATLEDMGLDGITDIAAQGDIIENSGTVDAVLTDLSLSLSPDGEAVTINLTQDQRNELALEVGFLNRNKENLEFTDEDVIAHVGERANALHWQNQSEQDIADWQAQGIIPEFGYDRAQSGQLLDLQNNAARTAWALGVAEQTADGINDWQSNRIGVTEGVEDATTRLLEHHERNPIILGSHDADSINYTFGGPDGYIARLERLQENPSVDEITEFRDLIDEVLTNDGYHISDDLRAMLEASRAEFDAALVGAQRTRTAASGDENLAVINLNNEDMQDEFARVVDESGGWIGKFNREFQSLDDQYLGVHADATDEEITAFEALASIPQEERTVEQQAAYSVLAQGLLGRNLTSGTESGVTRFDQGAYRAESYEEFLNDNSKQSIILGSAIVGTVVSLINPVAGGAIIVGGTGIGLTVDKVTGNDDISWGEVGTETGIAAGSLLVGGGVSRLATKGAGLIAPTTRGGQFALAGGVFVTEELASAAVIDTGAALLRGEGFSTQTLLDPVGLLYGLPFAAGDARRIMRGSPSMDTTINPNTPRLDVGEPGQLPTTQRLHAPVVDAPLAGRRDPLEPDSNPQLRIEPGVDGTGADAPLNTGAFSTDASGPDNIPDRVAVDDDLAQPLAGDATTGGVQRTDGADSTERSDSQVGDQGGGGGETLPPSNRTADGSAGDDLPLPQLGEGTPRIPEGMLAGEFRSQPGHLTGVSELQSIPPDQFLRGNDQVAGWIPHEIGEGLLDRLYSSRRRELDGVQHYSGFDSLREDIWREIASQPDYAEQFPSVDELRLSDSELKVLLSREINNNLKNAGFDPDVNYTRKELETFQKNHGPSLEPIERMSQGKAPVASHGQRGKGSDLVYEIHHMHPIETGGGVYDVNNLVISSPVKHKYDLHDKNMGGQTAFDPMQDIFGGRPTSAVDADTIRYRADQRPDQTGWERERTSDEVLDETKTARRHEYYGDYDSFETVIGTADTPPEVLSFTDLKEFNDAANEARPNTVYEFGSYRWLTDELGRTKRAEGIWGVESSVRNGGLTARIGKEGYANDVGFHLVADHNGGPTNRLNVVAANGRPVNDGLSNLNQGNYSTLENTLRNLSEDGPVEFFVEPRYSPWNETVRPDTFLVGYKVEGETNWTTQLFFNKRTDVY